MKRVKRFDAGGMASSSPQPAFTQFGATTPAFGSGIAGGMGNTAPMVQANPGGTGVGGVLAAPAPAMAQAPAMTPTAPTQAMRKGGAVKKSTKGGPVKTVVKKFAKGGAVMGRGRGDGCVTKGGTKGTIR